MMEKPTNGQKSYHMEKDAIIDRDPVYRIYRVFKNQSLGCFLREFENSKLARYSLISNINQYFKVFNQAEEVSHGQNLNKIIQVKKDESMKKRAVFIPPYEENLQCYLSRNKIDEQ